MNISSMTTDCAARFSQPAKAMMTLNPKTVALNWSNALACAEVCAAIYNWPCADDPLTFITHVITDPRTDAHALVQDRGNCIVVCFRGSKDPEDYIQDGKFEMVDLIWSDGELPARVHDGFLADFNAINVQIIWPVKRFSQARRTVLPTKPIFITGHSLGAALATLCALEFERLKFPIAGIYTFGSPRVGNRAFCKIYDDCLKDITFRIVDQNDIVPRVPPLLNGYRHCGNCIFLFSTLSEPDSEDDRLGVRNSCCYAVNPSLLRRAWSNCIGFWNAFRSVHDVLITDHHIGTYQAKMKNL